MSSSLADVSGMTSYLGGHLSVPFEALLIAFSIFASVAQINSARIEVFVQAVCTRESILIFGIRKIGF